MNRVGVSFAYWANNWNADICDSIKRAAKNKMEVLEIMSGSLLNADSKKLDEIKSLSKEYDIKLVMGITLNEKTDISSEDYEVRKNGIEFLIKILNILDKIDCRTMSGLTYGAWGGKISNLSEKLKRTELSIGSVKEVIKTAENYDIDYCVEVVNRFEQFMLNTAQEAKDYIEQIGSKKGKICLDTFHMSIEEDNIFESLKTAGSLLANVHLGENNRRIPGTGLMDWDRYFKVLKEINYTNPIVMEPFIKAGNEVGDGVALWRDLSNDANENQMDEMIVNGANFIRSKLAK